MFDQVLKAFGITDPSTLEQFSLLQSTPKPQSAPQMQQPFLPQLPPQQVSPFPPQQPQFSGMPPMMGGGGMPPFQSNGPFPPATPQAPMQQSGQFNISPDVLQMILQHMQGIVPQPGMTQ